MATIGQHIEVIDFPEYQTYSEPTTLWNKHPGDGWVLIKTMTQNYRKTHLEKYQEDVYITIETKVICDEIFTIITQEKIDQLLIDVTETYKTSPDKERHCPGFHKLVFGIREHVHKTVFEIIGKLPFEKQYKNLVYAMIQYQVGRAVRDYSGD